jgi:serine/threonine protein kinase
LWGLGATLYCALEGTAPFDRGPAAATLTAVVREETPVPRRAGVLAPLLRRLLNKDPGKRPEIREIRRALEAARNPAGTVDSATVSVATVPSDEAVADGDRSEQRPPPVAAPEPSQPARRPQPVAPSLARRVERVGRFTVKLAMVLLVLGALAIAALVALVSSLL